MDTLDIIRKAEREGGPERRRAIEDLLRYARDLNCQFRIGGGRTGGMNIRYGAIGYSILDVNTTGVVKLYVQPHPSREATPEYVEELNQFIEETGQLKPKTFPVQSYGHVDDKVEDIKPELLKAFIERAVLMIRREYYAPHYEEHEIPLLELDRL